MNYNAWPFQMELFPVIAYILPFLHSAFSITHSTFNIKQ